MSAFIVSKAHIDVLVSASAALPRYSNLYGSIDPDAAGAMLWRENHASVNYRYAQQEDAPEYKHATVRLNLRSAPTLAALLKLIDCYEYQTCECPEWKASEAFQFCDHLRGALISLLPGYDDMPWGIQDASEFAKPQEQRVRAVRS